MVTILNLQKNQGVIEMLKVDLVGKNVYYEILRSCCELKIPVFNKSGENFTATKQKFFSCQVSTIVTMMIFDILLLDG